MEPSYPNPASESTVETVTNCNDQPTRQDQIFGFKKTRQSNQYRPLERPWDLSEGAEFLLALIEKYQFKYEVKTQQYADLMGIGRRNLIFYLHELEFKGRLKILPKNKKRGRGKPNIYRTLEFDPEKWCKENGYNYSDFVD